MQTDKLKEKSSAYYWALTWRGWIFTFSLSTSEPPYPKAVQQQDRVDDEKRYEKNIIKSVENVK